MMGGDDTPAADAVPAAATAVPAAAKAVPAAAKAVVDALATLEARGLCIGTAGNVSVRVGDRLVISPSGVAPADLDPSMVAVLDADGHRLAGRPPSSELRLHQMVYGATGGGAVVHTHSPFATVIASTLTELPAIHYAIVRLGGPVRVAPYATFGTAALAEGVEDALRDRRAALLANHGAVTAAPTLAGALDDAVLLEWLCQLYWRARQIGPPRILTADELDDVRRQADRLGYEGLRP
jgi:L-fuculose-phosphate aldolase